MSSCASRVRRARRPGRTLLATVGVLASLTVPAVPAGGAAPVVAAAPVAGTTAAGAVAAAPALPSRTAVLRAAMRAADYYRPTYAVTGLTPQNGWSWSTYVEGVQDLRRQVGAARYLRDGLDWGSSNDWGLNTRETNPDTVKAAQDYDALHRVDRSVPLTAADSRMAADLTGLPLSRYDWVDALFMGLPDWALWSNRKADAAYLDKMDALFAWNRDRGATSSRCAGRTVRQPGLYDAATGLWYRDCTFVGATDANGRKVLWGRGNGWVIAAMADVLRSLPAGSTHAAPYASMLRSMAASLLPLQGSDGLWRASLADPGLYPGPETSATALVTYALADGVRTGILDAGTYRPVVARAWQGLSTLALRPSGFLTGCEGPGVGPAAPYAAADPRTAPTAGSAGTVNADSPPYCVGAFLMASSQVARLSPDLALRRALTASAEQVGNEATHLVDGSVVSRWSARGFPQVATVDLGRRRTIGATMVVPYADRAYRYTLRYSTDRVTWHLLVDRRTSAPAGPSLTDVTPVAGRYVRLRVVGGPDDASGPVTWSSICELGVYAPPAP